MAKLALGIGSSHSLIKDPAIWLKRGEADVLNSRFGPAIQGLRPEVEPELTVKFARLGARFYEIPIQYHGRTYIEGKKIRFHHVFPVLWTLVCTRFFWSPPRP